MHAYDTNVLVYKLKDKKLWRGSGVLKHLSLTRKQYTSWTNLSLNLSHTRICVSPLSVSENLTAVTMVTMMLFGKFS